MERTYEGVILLDGSPGEGEEFDASFLERDGHPVLVCHGAAEQPCPLMSGHGCPKLEAAHGIVFALDLDVPQHRAILERYKAAGGDVPIRVVVHPDQALRYRDDLSGVEVWTHEPTVADLDGFAARIEAQDRSNEDERGVEPGQEV